jgi:hypothetical protein
MPGRTKLYNDMHSYIRGRGEHLFGMAHAFALMRHSWDGRQAPGHHRLLCRVRVLFGFLSFHLHRRLRYEVFGPWPHFPNIDPAAPSPNGNGSEPHPSLIAPRLGGGGGA